MSQKNFAITPSVSISRSKFKRPSQHKTSFNLGDIVPIYCDADILPGDTVSLDLASLIRMSNPIAPIMDNIYIDYYAFFVPNRLIWSNWKKFMGENDSSSGAITSEPNFPVCAINGAGMFSGRGAPLSTGCLGDYFGLPVGCSGVSSSSLSDELIYVSALPGRAYFLIYNDWFRDQNLIAPFTLNLSDGFSSRWDLALSGLTAYTYSNYLLKAAKESDYFTRALPYAQKGSPVSLPLGTVAPVGILNNSTSALAPNTTVQFFGTGTGSTIQVGEFSDSIAVSAGSQYAAAKLVADLSTATAATINQLRFAFQYQKFLEKDALYGTRYWEILKGHFGITAPDASLQRPELLGHFRQRINIDQVLQTTGSNVATPSQQTLGIPGANSVSGKSEHIISKSFVEHGVLMILAVARHDQTYGQGINRMWSRRHRTDFYFPVFANLGAQEIKNKEIYLVKSGTINSNVTNELPFGYQEAWAEYRYKPSITTGLMNPAVANSLSFWNLGNNFASLPTLSQSFIEQDRSNLQRALVTGSTGPDFIADFYFDATYVRPMPMYSIPGLIDHH